MVEKRLLYRLTALFAPLLNITLTHIRPRLRVSRVGQLTCAFFIFYGMKLNYYNNIDGINPLPKVTPHNIDA